MMLLNFSTMLPSTTLAQYTTNEKHYLMNTMRVVPLNPGT